jgi:hypothetical protein
MTIDQPAPELTEADPRANVLIGIDLTPPIQNRWSVFFRGILVIPLAILLAILFIPLYVVLILSWFAALFTGKVPESFHKFMTNFQRFSLNVNAYEFLLIPRWPGINFSARSDEQVSIEIPNEKQSRLSIFFRGLLTFPAALLSGLWNLAHIVFATIMWFWVLIKGRAPRSLHQYGALWLRYSTRLSAFSLLLTSAQPWHGLRGDGVAMEQAEQTAHDAIAATSTLSSESTEEARPGVVDWAPSSFDERAVGAQPSPTTKPTTWFVVSRARTLVNWSFPLGAILLAVYIVLISLSLGGASQTIEVDNSYNATFNVGKTFAATVGTCTTVSCVHQAAATASIGQLGAASYLSGGFFGGNASAYRAYSTDLNNLNSDYVSISNATTVSKIRLIVATWQTDFTKAQTDAVALLRAIG